MHDHNPAVHSLLKILGIKLCLHRFFPEFEALFLKSDYLFMIQSTGHH